MIALYGCCHPGGGSPYTPGLPISSFDGTNGTDVEAYIPEQGGPWTAEAGAGELQGNRLDVTAVDDGEALFLTDAEEVPEAISVEVRSDSGTHSGGIMCRVNLGDGSGFLAQLQVGTDQLAWYYRASDGSYDQRGTISIALDTNTNYQLWVDPATLTAKVNNGYELVCTDDTENPAETGVGLRFDDTGMSANNFNADEADPGTGFEPPAAPSGFSGDALTETTIRLAWTDNSSNETGFEIERSPAGAGTWSGLTTAGEDDELYDDASAAPGTEYDYRIRAVNDHGESAWVTTTAGTWPSTPGACTATYNGGTGAIDLAWGDVDGETIYRIERSEEGGGFAPLNTTGPDDVAYADGPSGLTAGNDYQYRVRAENLYGESGWSTSNIEEVPP